MFVTAMVRSVGYSLSSEMGTEEILEQRDEAMQTG